MRGRWQVRVHFINEPLDNIDRLETSTLEEAAPLHKCVFVRDQNNTAEQMEDLPDGGFLR